jgi:hypothetical protein
VGCRQHPVFCDQSASTDVSFVEINQDHVGSWMRSHRISPNDSYTAICSGEKDKSVQGPPQRALHTTLFQDQPCFSYLQRKHGWELLPTLLLPHTNLQTSDCKSWPLGGPCWCTHWSHATSVPGTIMMKICHKLAASVLRPCQGQYCTLVCTSSNCWRRCWWW